MTLTELKYIVALAREKHFGRAADTCHVSQPTLSVAIKKLEDELEVKLFERSASEVTVTPLGEKIIRQAQSVLDQAASIKEMARCGQDPVAGALTLGVIYTIGPYLLPELVRHSIERTPQMPLILQENFTIKLLEMLRTGEIDCAILAEPFPDAGLAMAPLYDEPFLAAVPHNHALAAQDSVSAEQLKNETMLLLGAGHCFRDHVLEVCPEFARYGSNSSSGNGNASGGNGGNGSNGSNGSNSGNSGSNGHSNSNSGNSNNSYNDGIRKAFEGSSLETIKHMVAAGMGVTLVPRLAVPREALLPDTRRRQSDESHIRYLPVQEIDGSPPPLRRVVLAWRRSFTRYEAIAALRNAIYACELPGVARLS